MLQVSSKMNYYLQQQQEESFYYQFPQKQFLLQQQLQKNQVKILDHRRGSIESLQSTQISNFGSHSGGSANSSQLDEQEDYIQQDLFDTQSRVQEIDVMPKRKVFQNVQERQLFVAEYKKKIKTELCKNWNLKGTCKFGDKCSFAHGRNELKDKSHLHTYYKTKPCKQFFQTGYCPYGYRCQYLHSDINNHQEFRKFLSKLQQAKKLCVMQHNLQQKNGYKAKFSSLQQSRFVNEVNVAELLGAFSVNKNNRLKIFREVSGQQVSQKQFDEKDLIFNEVDYK